MQIIPIGNQSGERISDLYTKLLTTLESSERTDFVWLHRDWRIESSPYENLYESFLLYTDSKGTLCFTEMEKWGEY